METATMGGRPVPIAPMPMLIVGGIDIATADARYLKKNSVQVAATDYLALGATPPASGAVRVDESSFGAAFAASHTTALANFGAQAGYVYIGGNKQLYINTSGRLTWILNSSAVGFAEITSNQATTRFIPGANGFSFRNSGNSIDRLTLNDAGTALVMKDGLRAANVALRSATGELTAGMWMYGTDDVSPADAWLCPNGNTSVGRIAGIGYFDSSAANQWRSALEASHANGFSTLKLMRTGGTVVIGTDPGGTSVLRVGGNITTNATLSASIVRVAGAASGSAGTVTFGTSTQNTVGAAGGASALPATPSGYLRFFVGATEYVLPYYAQA